MPELPEVETTRRGIEPLLRGRSIEQVIVRQPVLRWPIPRELAPTLRGQTIGAVERRAKYLLFKVDSGTLIVHLGMSGSLRIVAGLTQPEIHDHVDIVLENGSILRYRDPRRFGALLWTEAETKCHPLLSRLGPEPLSREFTASRLYALARKRHLAVKSFLMDSSVVVGVGNIYANESLFRAGIHPMRRANLISEARYARLVDAVQEILCAAIQRGGTTLRDFVDGSGRPGYFAQELRAYGRTGKPCQRCGAPILVRRIGQRSSFYCSHCQH